MGGQFAAHGLGQEKSEKDNKCQTWEKKKGVGASWESAPGGKEIYQGGGERVHGQGC